MLILNFLLHKLEFRIILIIRKFHKSIYFYTYTYVSSVWQIRMILESLSLSLSIRLCAVNYSLHGGKIPRKLKRSNETKHWPDNNLPMFIINSICSLDDVCIPREWSLLCLKIHSTLNIIPICNTQLASGNFLFCAENVSDSSQWKVWP